MSEEFDDNEFSYSFWIEQHRIMQENRDVLQKKLNIAIKALKSIRQIKTVVDNNIVKYHEDIASDALAEIEEMK